MKDLLMENARLMHELKDISFDIKMLLDDINYMATEETEETIFDSFDKLLELEEISNLIDKTL